jgi:MFS family permease
MLASFVTYTSMYAFRKPITAATFDGMMVMGMNYKSLLIVTQVLGYLTSKFVGIKYISELKSAYRFRLLVGLMFISYTGLFLFAITPSPYNIIWILLNGFPLGFIWGIIFSYLEGRRATDVLACFLSISFVVGSGLVKSIGVWTIKVMGISEVWMPFVVASYFFPVLILSSYVLDLIPEPEQKDKELRTERLPMNSEDRKTLLRIYGIGLVPVMLLSMLLTLSRDIKDNFLIEIFDQFKLSSETSVYLKTELSISIILLILLSLIVLIRNNARAFFMIHIFMSVGLSMVLLSTFVMDFGTNHLFGWMILHGIGLYLAYILLQSLYFERFIAYFRIKGNVGFFVYMVDFSGYLASCLVIIYKEFFHFNMSWSTFFINMNYISAIAGIILTVMALLFFFTKNNNPDVEKKSI